MKIKLPSLPFTCVLAAACISFSSSSEGECQQGCDLFKGNAFLGDNALSSNTTGDSNTAVGDTALSANTTGNFNTACGTYALANSTTASVNTAVGANALASDTVGFNNTAIGFDALESNITGLSNTATGLDALQFNTSGSGNTANGAYALGYNTTGRFNTAVGINAINNNIAGDFNTAVGFESLYSSQSGVHNTAIGARALRENSSGSRNTAIGRDTLYKNDSGSENVALGNGALSDNRTGDNNIAIGLHAGARVTDGSNNIDIANSGARESDTIRIGTSGTQANTYIAGINGVTVADGVNVVIDTQGHLGTINSSARYKEAIKPMDKSSEAILSLKPVSFRYKKQLDPHGTPQFGLVAEDVAKVDPDLVAKDDKGRPYTVRYDAVNAMLLNEFLKEHAKVGQLEQNLAEQRDAIIALTAKVRQLTRDLP